MRNVDLVGLKGSNLATLAELYPMIPPYFVLTTEAYRDFLKEAHLSEKVSRAESLDLENRYKLRGLILTQRVPEGIGDEIFLAYSKLKKGRGENFAVAVRSSATAEDMPDFSFAGQLDSFLNVKGFDDLLESIKGCWVSLWGERAIYYRERFGLLSQGIGVAVLVQEMVAAEASGVLFTVNPVAAEVDRLIIEANWGLGTAVVEGKTGSDSYIVDKKGFSVKDKKIGEKGVMDVPDPNGKGGCLSVDVPQEKRCIPVLTGRQIAGLARLGSKVESHFQKPQDIEWALHRGEFYLLQSRPITSKIPEAGGRIWTDHFFGERFPHPVSPLSWSILRRPIEKSAFLEPLSYLGFKDLREKDITKLFCGRPYTDLRVFQMLYQHFPKFLIPQDKKWIFSFPYRVDCPHPLKRYLSLALSASKDMDWIIPLHRRNWKRFAGYYEKKLEEIDKVDLKRISWEGLVALFRRTERLTDRFLGLHRWSITFADVLYGILRRVVERWFGGKASSLCSALVSGLEGNVTVEINKGLWDLSRIIARSERLSAILTQTDSPHFLEMLREIPEADAFLKRYQAFLDSYGHRSNSLDLSYPSWEEDQSYLLHIIRGYLQCNEERSPQALEGGRRLIREGKTNLILWQLSEGVLPKVLPIKLFLFKRLLRLTQEFVLLRENQRLYWQMSLTRMRKILLEMGGRLFEEGLISRRDDVFFLTIDEVLSYTKGSDLMGLILLRKREKENNLRVSPPHLIGEMPSKGDLQTLDGIGVSPGRSIGRASVLTDLRNYRQLKKGEILVTQSTDPGWTPLFGMASGLVMEVGGLLSHGSIVAREFGIPAVVGVKEATRRIHPGDLIAVDGDCGRVELQPQGDLDV